MTPNRPEPDYTIHRPVSNQLNPHRKQTFLDEPELETRPSRTLRVPARRTGEGSVRVTFLPSRGTLLVQSWNRSGEPFVSREIPLGDALACWRLRVADIKEILATEREMEVAAAEEATSDQH